MFLAEEQETAEILNFDFGRIVGQEHFVWNVLGGGIVIYSRQCHLHCLWPQRLAGSQRKSGMKISVMVSKIYSHLLLKSKQDLLEPVNLFVCQAQTT